MHRSVAAIGLLLTALLAGCLNGADPDVPDPVDDIWTIDTSTGHLHVDYAPGTLSNLTAEGATNVILPGQALVLTEGRLLPHAGGIDIADGETVQFLAPVTGPLELAVDGEVHVLDAGPWSRDWDHFVSGHKVIDHLRYHAQNLTGRVPGSPTYTAALEYYADTFRDLGYDVSVDPYGFDSLPCMGLACPTRFANVVASKPGNDPNAGIIFVAGGHFDLVPQTTHGAFDDTTGTITALELARALAPYEFDHTLYFATWGGEESGILGSQFWVQSNRHLLPFIESYWNMDVVGLSWPAPLPEPDPIVVAAGIDVPDLVAGDGSTIDPLSQRLLDWAQEIQQDWLGLPDEVNGTDMWYYEGVLSGQVNGYLGVNAQSDHTPFMAAGVPSFFAFNGDALGRGNPVAIHSEADSWWNMTKYAYFGTEADIAIGMDIWASQEQMMAGEDALARSIEVAMWLPLYHTLLVDAGIFDPLNLAEPI